MLFIPYKHLKFNQKAFSHRILIIILKAQLIKFKILLKLKPNPTRFANLR